MTLLKRTIQLSVGNFMLLLSVLAIGWLIASFLLGRIPGSGFPQTSSAFMLTFWQTIFIGVLVSVVLDRYLNAVFGGTEKQRLSSAGMADVYSSRQDATDDMRTLVSSAHEISIVGISLRDFLLDTGKCRSVWQAMVDRLVSEDKSGKSENRGRLKVRLLLLDPQSGEGIFRHRAEQAHIGASGLKHDVPRGLDEVNRVRNLLRDKEYLEVKLYHHCPFAFMFMTCTDGLVEQYYYKDHSANVDLPLVHYKGKQLSQLLESFDTAWKEATPAVLSMSRVGTDDAINEARIGNIYLRTKRGELGEREVEVLNGTTEGTVRILAITGKFYAESAGMRKALQDARRRKVEVQAALMNPTSGQAILRAIADSCHPSDIKQRLCRYDWEQHKESRLYQDVRRTARELLSMECTVRLSSGIIGCALFQTMRCVFVEQYVYGRSQEFQANRVLGGEYPVFEYDCQFDPEGKPAETPELQLLRATFDVIWDSYSEDASSYLQMSPADEKARFQKSLDIIRPVCDSERQDPSQGRAG